MSIKEINKLFDENRAYLILGDCKRGAISIELGVFNIKDMFTQQILSLIEELEKEKELSGYGGTLAIEGSAEIYQLGKRFNRLTIEKIIQKKINRAIEELEGLLPKKGIGIFALNKKQQGFNEAIDQMRASIKSFLK